MCLYSSLYSLGRVIHITLRIINVLSPRKKNQLRHYAICFLDLPLFVTFKAFEFVVAGGAFST